MLRGLRPPSSLTRAPEPELHRCGHAARQTRAPGATRLCRIERRAIRLRVGSSSPERGPCPHTRVIAAINQGDSDQGLAFAREQRFALQGAGSRRPSRSRSARRALKSRSRNFGRHGEIGTQPLQNFGLALLRIRQAPKCAIPLHSAHRSDWFAGGRAPCSPRRPGQPREGLGEFHVR